MSEFGRIAVEILRHIQVDKLEGRTVLLTGASGLVGSTLSQVLARTPLKRLYLQTRNGFRHEPPEKAKLIYADLANPNDCARLPNADVIISGANYGQPLRFMADPLLALRSASYGLMALLEKCNVGGRFMFLSSSEVYIDSPHTPPLREDQVGMIDPYHPRACYIMGKLYGEAMTYLYRGKGISTVAVRHGITYGPGARKGDKRSWAAFIERAVTTSRLELLDSGAAVRGFCYMTDGIELILQALLDGTQPVYNIAGRDNLSIRELAGVISQITGAELVLPPNDDLGVKGTPMDVRLDASLIEAEFGKTDYVPIEEGMRRTIDWWKEVYGGRSA